MNAIAVDRPAGEPSESKACIDRACCVWSIDSAMGRTNAGHKAAVPGTAQERGKLPELLPLPLPKAPAGKGGLVGPRDGAPKHLSWRDGGQSAASAQPCVMPWRIQLIRKRAVAGGAEQFVRLEINRTEMIQKLLLLNQAAQLDALFDGVS